MNHRELVNTFDPLKNEGGTGQNKKIASFVTFRFKFLYYENPRIPLHYCPYHKYKKDTLVLLLVLPRFCNYRYLLGQALYG